MLNVSVCCMLVRFIGSGQNKCRNLVQVLNPKICLFIQAKKCTRFNVLPFLNIKDKGQLSRLY